MSWNYRLLAHKKDNSFFLHIYDVYYDENDVPNGYSKTPSKFMFDESQNVNWYKEKLKEALKKPILSVENFPKEF